LGLRSQSFPLLWQPPEQKRLPYTRLVSFSPAHFPFRSIFFSGWNYWMYHEEPKKREERIPLLNFSGLVSTPIILDAPLARAPSEACEN